MDAFIVLVKLLCAHLCANFIFQTDSINKGKHKSGGKGTTCVENVLMCIESYIAWKEMTIIKGHVSEKPRRGAYNHRQNAPVKVQRKRLRGYVLQHEPRKLFV